MAAPESGSLDMEEGLIFKRNNNQRLISKSGHFNVHQEGNTCWHLFTSTSYHYFLNQPWWRLMLISLVHWIGINFVFGAFYYPDLANMRGAVSFQDAYFFSLQTMSTIGYGNLTPTSLYLQIVVTIQSWVSLLSTAVLLALIVNKLARPSRLRHSIAFSTVACITGAQASFSPDNPQWHPTGRYTASGQFPTLSIRFLNSRTRQLCNPTLRLLLLIKEPNEADNLQSDHLVLHELDYELMRQSGRPRTINYSLPYLPLPWTVTHRVDETSPLFGFTRADLKRREAEVIIVFDSVDELTSQSFQARMSWVADEIRWGQTFVEMLHRAPGGSGKLAVAHSLLSETMLVEGDAWRSANASLRPKSELPAPAAVPATAGAINDDLLM